MGAADNTVRVQAVLGAFGSHPRVIKHLDESQQHSHAISTRKA